MEVRGGERGGAGRLASVSARTIVSPVVVGIGTRVIQPFLKKYLDNVICTLQSKMDFLWQN